MPRPIPGGGPIPVHRKETLIIHTQKTDSPGIITNVVEFVQGTYPVGAAPFLEGRLAGVRPVPSFRAVERHGRLQQVP